MSKMSPVEVEIREQWQPIFEGLKADYAAYMTREATALLAKYDRRQLRGLYNAWGHDGNFFRELGQKLIDGLYDRPSQVVQEPSLNVAAVEKLSARLAEDAIESMILKLISKLGRLEKATLLSVDVNTGCMQFFGSIDGNNVFLEQARIINCSSKGKLFHQWPARITLNGEKVSEAAFKKLVA